MSDEATDYLVLMDESFADLRRHTSSAIAAISLRQTSSLTLGKRIHQRRGVLNLTLDEVAKAAGCARTHVWELEQDRSRNPTVAMVWKLSKALGLPFLVLAADALETVKRMEVRKG